MFKLIYNQFKDLYIDYIMSKKINKAPMLQNYFDTLKYNISKFGKKTMVLWQCGGFYEVYALKNEKINDYEEGKLQIETCNEVCDFSIVPKGKQKFMNKQLCMAGIPVTADMEKIIGKIKREGFTIVIFAEVGDDPISKGKIREQIGIFSPGTHFNLNSKQMSNNIMCIWIEERKQNFLNKVPFVINGMSCIDIFTGQSSIYQYEKRGNKLHNPTTYDDMSRFYSIYNPEELIIIHNFKEKSKINDIIKFASLYSKKTYKVCLNTSGDYSELEKMALQFKKQTYQEKILNKFFKITDYSQFLETTNLREYTYACQSFCFLLDFIYSHNPNLIYNIHKPCFEDTGDKLRLANHSLHQLNIVETHQDKGKYSSLQKFLNKCVTPMGKRKFKNLLLHPTTNIDYLNNEYNITEYIKDNYDRFEDIRKDLNKIRDIERLYRKIILNKVLPCEIAQFYYNMEIIVKIQDILENEEIVNSYMKEKINIDIKKNCEKLMTFLFKYMDIDKALLINNKKYEVNFFKKGNFKYLDKADNDYEMINNKLNTVRRFFSDLIKKNMFKNGKKISDNSYIKLHQTEKTGVFLEVTNTRLNILKQELKIMDKKIIPCEDFDLNTLKFPSGTGGNKRIDGDSMQKIYFKIIQTKDNLKETLEGSYREFVKGTEKDNKLSLQSFDVEMDNFVKYVSLLDLIITKAYLAKKYNYCKPIINEKSENAFINVEEIRHPLIEQIQENELYVTNDIVMGNKETKGVLLYGINAVGKSSFIRSIGTTIIMAQAGLFVPCTNMEYKPYKSLYTRILGIDNIFKSLSTFAVEMCELTTIIVEADENSLILGDELCKGTEHPSALSLFSSGLINLSSRGSTYIFATHFHELVNYDRIKNIDNLKFKHISVSCNDGVLIYDRILRDGPGSNMYGLEVCKSLDMPQDFLDLAYKIRRELYPEYEGIGKKKQSIYNSKLIKGNCELCDAKGIEVHHLNPQKKANKEGFIGSFHKNHKANLINICKKCHLKITKNDIVHKKIRTSDGMKLVEI